MKEKASPSKRQRRSAKGTVLFTVVSVMMVLIVFLMGTLALAATANTRANRNYQKIQTETVARTVLDSVVESINRDTGAAGGIKAQIAALPVSSTTGLDFEVGITGDANTYTVNIRPFEERTIYSASQGKWVDGIVYELRTTVTKTTTGVDTVYTAYIADESVAGPGSGSGGGGGAFVSLGGLDGNILGTGGYVMGGSSIGLSNTGDEDETYQLGTNGKVSLGSPAYVKGNLYTMNNANVVFDRLGYTDSDNKFHAAYFAVTGNLYLAHNLTAEYADSFKWDPTTNVAVREIPCLYVGDTFYSKASVDELWGGDASAHPANLYCGQFVTNSQTAFYGDVYCFNAKDGTNTNVMNGTTSIAETVPRGVSKIDLTSNGTRLYEWVNTNVHKTVAGNNNYTFGNFFSNGDLIVNMNSIDQKGDNAFAAGNVQIKGDFTINGGNDKTYEIKGDLYVGGKLTVSSGTILKCRNLYVNNIENNGKISVASTEANYVSGTPGKIVSPNGAATTTTAQWADESTVTFDWAGANVAAYDWGTQYQNTPYSYTVYTSVNNGPTTSETKTGTVWVQVNAGEDQSEAYRVSKGVAKLKEDGAAFRTEAEARANPTVTVNGGEPDLAPVQITSVETVCAANTGDSIYPSTMTKDKIKSDIIIEPSQDEYNKYPTSLASDELKGFNIKDDTTAMTSQGNLTTVTDSCVLTGTFKNVYIEPSANKKILVVLDNVTIDTGYSMVINENKGDVILFVKGTFTLEKGSLITTDYIKNIKGTPTAADASFKEWTSEDALSGCTADMEIKQVVSDGDWRYPDVFVFSAPNAVFDLGGSGHVLVTANVRAPLMQYKHRNGSDLNKVITYKMPTGATKIYASGSGNNNIGLFGQLICKSAGVENSWSMCYVEKEATATTCSCGCAACTDPTHPDTCPCACGESNCICKSSTSGGGSGEKHGMGQNYTVMFYNTY